MAKKLTAAEVQARIADRGITLIGEYVDTKTKTAFRCADGHEWEATPNSIMKGHGCPQCAQIGRRSNAAEVQARIADRGITLIGEYVNTLTKTRFRCAAEHEWETVASSVMRGRGCPHCAKLITADVQRRLDADSRGIALIGEYVTSNTKTRFRCTAGHEWEAVPYSILRGSSCPHCAKQVPLTAEIVQTRLDAKKRDITMIGAYTDTQTKTLFRCHEGHEWMARPNDVMRGKGCPQCAAYGIWQHERAFVYVMDYDRRYTKIGITVEPSRRLRELTLATSHAVELVALYEAGTGRDAWEMEQNIHRHLRAFSAGLRGFEGASELFHVKPETACRLIRKLGGIPTSIDDLAQPAESC